MSFSADVKNELEEVIPGSGHCKVAEMAAILWCLADVNEEGTVIELPNENISSIRKCFTLLNKTYNINTEFLTDVPVTSKGNLVLTFPAFPVRGVINEVGFLNPEKQLKRDCCKRSFVRGVFLANGFIGNPSKGYHLEFLFQSEEKANFVKQIFESFNMEMKLSRRRDNYVCYLKESEAISDVLSIMGAHRSMMGFVNEKIVRNVRNSLNRRVNCEVANSAKTIVSASKQKEDIILIRDKVGLEALPESLKEMALIRLEYPDVPLSGLGSYLNPPVGKSGVNHRLRKISEFADTLRNKTV